MEKARPVFTNLRWQPGLDDVRAIVQDDQEQTTRDIECRSLHWKIFLLFETTEYTEWQRTIASTRSAYDSLRTHFSSPDASQSTASVSNPLDEDMESHWSKLQLDETLRQEIKQDVDRCMPEIDYFRSQENKQKLENILYVFCKLNPDLSYRQGMHELLAPILFVVNHDAFVVETPSLLEEDIAISNMFDAAYVEHDAFTLFSQLMQNAKGFYEQTTHTALENPLVDRSKRIVNDLLFRIDPELSNHLQNIGIAPQIFLIRWLRLLFGREFTFSEVLAIWDVIFSEGLSLAVVDYICIAMLLRIRWDLLRADHNEALSLLLHYPALDQSLSAHELALDSTHLQRNLTRNHGRVLIQKYTGRLPADYQAPTPSISRNVSNLPLFGSAKLTRRNDSNAVSREPSDLEAMMRSTMKNLYNRGEQLGIGKAVRSAVEDVHRRAQEIKEARTPTKNSRDSDALALRLMKLEQRNIDLSKLLEKAVADLWLTQKEIAEAAEHKTNMNSLSEADIEKMSVAIGQVQFVQIYLQDGTLPLPQTELSNSTLSSSTTNLDTMDEVKDLSQIEAVNQEPTDITSASTVDDSLAVDRRYEREHDETVNRTRHAAPQIKELHDGPLAEDKTKERPSLAESSYSWMLGQANDDIKTAAGAKTVRKATTVRPDFLFGDGEDLSGASTASPRRTKRAQKRNAVGVSDDSASLPYE